MDYKNGHLYSYVTRTPSTRTAETRAAGEEIDHSRYGLEKTMIDSYGTGRTETWRHDNNSG